MSDKLIALFESTHETLRAEKEFKIARIKTRTELKPRLLSSNCQMALSFSHESFNEIKKVIKKRSLRLTRFYRKDKSGQWVEEA